jgi:YbbR domain-containing protein
VNEVRVGVRGTWTRLRSFDERNIEPIRVDLTSAKDGVFHFDDSMVKLGPGLRVASITPPEVKLTFEPRATKEVPIRPALDGQPADGFRVTKVVAEPATVHVEGPKSAIAGITQVSTRPVKVAGARAPVLGEVLLEPEAPHVHYVEGKTVIVNAEVQPAIVERTFDDVSVRVIGLSRMDGTLEPNTVKLILRGPSDLVLNLKREDLNAQVEAALVDGRPPARYVRTVTVAGLPPGVAVEVRPDSVMLATHRKKAE